MDPPHGTANLLMRRINDPRPLRGVGQDRTATVSACPAVVRFQDGSRVGVRPLDELANRGQI